MERELQHGTISGFRSEAWGTIGTLLFADGSFVHCHTRLTVSALADAGVDFGDTIEYEVDEVGVLQCFSPVEEI
jgi:hypothetical protein|tara:strand:+ start:1104 stop:1325 length:222 start_codon:yes stop_codon:yes gene_type:complete